MITVTFSLPTMATKQNSSSMASSPIGMHPTVALPPWIIMSPPRFDRPSSVARFRSNSFGYDILSERWNLLFGLRYSMPYMPSGICLSPSRSFGPSRPLNPVISYYRGIVHPRARTSTICSFLKTRIDNLPFACRATSAIHGLVLAIVFSRSSTDLLIRQDEMKPRPKSHPAAPIAIHTAIQNAKYNLLFLMFTVTVPPYCTVTIALFSRHHLSA